MKEITNEQDFAEFISSTEKVVVDFWAPWCGPCKAMLPVLERANESAPGKIAKVNVDEVPEIAAKFGIRSIPTMIVFQENQMLDKKIGSASMDEIIQMVN
jgi:thioredoxin 1